MAYMHNPSQCHFVNYSSCTVTAAAHCVGAAGISTAHYVAATVIAAAISEPIGYQSDDDVASGGNSQYFKDSGVACITSVPRFSLLCGGHCLQSESFLLLVCVLGRDEISANLYKPISVYKCNK